MITIIVWYRFIELPEPCCMVFNYAFHCRLLQRSW